MNSSRVTASDSGASGRPGGRSSIGGIVVGGGHGGRNDIEIGGVWVSAATDAPLAAAAARSLGGNGSAPASPRRPRATTSESAMDALSLTPRRSVKSSDAVGTAESLPRPGALVLPAAPVGPVSAAGAQSAASKHSKRHGKKKKKKGEAEPPEVRPKSACNTARKQGAGAGDAVAMSTPVTAAMSPSSVSVGGAQAGRRVVRHAPVFPGGAPMAAVSAVAAPTATVQPTSFATATGVDAAIASAAGRGGIAFGDAGRAVQGRRRQHLPVFSTSYSTAWDARPDGAPDPDP